MAEMPDTYQGPSAALGYAAKPLPDDKAEQERIIEVMRGHLALAAMAHPPVPELKATVLAELETKALFEVGFSTLFWAQEGNADFINQMNEKDQVRLVNAFSDQKLWYMNWANLA